MKKVLALLVIAGSLAACNNEGNGSAMDDSVIETTPSVVDTTTATTPMDSAAVAPMVDTTTAGTGTANSGTSGLGATGSGTTTDADSMR